MFLNIMKFILIILFNSVGHSFSMESLDSIQPEDLQSVYDQYTQNPYHSQIKVPQHLCDLYKLHKSILEDEMFYNQENNNKNNKKDSIKEFCSERLFLNDNQNCNKEILSIIEHVNSVSEHEVSSSCDINIMKLSTSGFSGAGIYIIEDKSNSENKRIAKILRLKLKEDLENGFMELSNSLIALSLNPDPARFKMARIFSAGYSFQEKFEEPYTFCMLLEKASGESIKEQIYNHIYQPDMFHEILRHSALYLAYFHVKSQDKYKSDADKDADKIERNNEIKNKILNRRNVFSGKIKKFSESISKNNNFSFKNALNSINEMCNCRISQEDICCYLETILRKFHESKVFLEDRVITHGDMHGGNLCYGGANVQSPLLSLTMIDFSTMPKTYGAIGEPTEDVGKFLGSLWESAALYCAQEDFYTKDDINTLYNTLFEWQEVFAKTYIKSFVQEKTRLDNIQLDSGDGLNVFCSWWINFCDTGCIVVDRKTLETLACTNKSYFKFLCIFRFLYTFAERCYFYKLCLYNQVFSNLETKQEGKELLLYFFSRETKLDC